MTLRGKTLLLVGLTLLALTAALGVAASQFWIGSFVRLEEEQATQVFFLVVGVAGVFGLLTLVLLERHVLARLRRLGVELRRIGGAKDLSRRVTVKGTDELSALASDVNGMLDALERANSAREVTEAALRERDGQLHHSRKMEAIGRLAGGVAHDFNNLMTVIVGFAEMVIEGGRVDEGDARAVESIRQAGERAAVLTQQLLAFSRKQPTRPSVVDVGVLLHESRETIRLLGGDRMDLRISCAPGLEKVFVDPALVTQVVMNLVANARDAMPGGGRLRIDTAMEIVGPGRPGLPEDRYVRLTLCDDGGGIEPELLCHIFEPFYTTKGIGHGAGLGLASVHGSVHQAGGRIEVESTPGVGTTFRVYLPSVGFVRVGAPPTVSHSSPAAAGARILLVEDEAAVRAVMAAGLRLFGFRVIAAEDARDALAALDANTDTIDCLVTDVLMPGMNGTELARLVLARQPGIRVLIVSGYPDDPSARAAIAGGATFLQKPFGPEELASTVQALLDSATPVAV